MRKEKHTCCAEISKGSGYSRDMATKVKEDKEQRLKDSAQKMLAKLPHMSPIDFSSAAAGSCSQG